jgi:hypothetical protein
MRTLSQREELAQSKREQAGPRKIFASFTTLHYLKG